MVDPTALSRVLCRSQREGVQTHVPHILAEDQEQPDQEGAVRTACGYYLTAEQYRYRFAWTEEPISVTHICTHCRDALAAELSEDGDGKFAIEFTTDAGNRRRYRFEKRPVHDQWHRYEEERDGGKWRPVGHELVEDVEVVDGKLESDGQIESSGDPVNEVRRA